MGAKGLQTQKICSFVLQLKSQEQMNIQEQKNMNKNMNIFY